MTHPLLRTLLLISLVATFHPLKAEEIPATLAWADRTPLGTTVSGVIRSVAVAPGERVSRGALLLQLDDAEWIAEQAHAQAAVREAHLLKQEAERELERNQELYERTLLSDHELRVAESDAARATTAWRLAQLQEVRAAEQLQRATLRAPFAGVVLAIHVRPGEVIINQLAATPLVTLAAADEMLALAQVDSHQAAALKRGAPLALSLGEERIEGRITHIGLEPSTGTPSGYPLSVRFPLPEKRLLRAGERTTLHLP